MRCFRNLRPSRLPAVKSRCHNDAAEDTKLSLDYAAMLAVALAEARKGLAEGGIPIGAAIFDVRGQLVGAGHNRRVQHGDPSMHGETDAFRNAGRQRSYRKLIMVTTLAPCWYCSGLVRQFGFGTLVVGESRNFQGGVEWLRSLGVNVVDLDSEECVSLLAEYIRANPEVWHEDIGEESLQEP
jgi:creatinine deaminase